MRRVRRRYADVEVPSLGTTKAGHPIKKTRVESSAASLCRERLVPVFQDNPSRTALPYSNVPGAYPRPTREVALRSGLDHKRTWRRSLHNPKTKTSACLLTSDPNPLNRQTGRTGQKKKSLRSHERWEHPKQERTDDHFGGEIQGGLQEFRTTTCEQFVVTDGHMHKRKTCYLQNGRPIRSRLVARLTTDLIKVMAWKDFQSTPPKKQQER